jgi:hypothetical protein
MYQTVGVGSSRQALACTNNIPGEAISIEGAQSKRTHSTQRMRTCSSSWPVPCDAICTLCSHCICLLMLHRATNAMAGSCSEGGVRVGGRGNRPLPALQKRHLWPKWNAPQQLHVRRGRGTLANRAQNGDFVCVQVPNQGARPGPCHAHCGQANGLRDSRSIIPCRS